MAKGKTKTEKSKAKKRHRSAVTGKLVSKEYANENPGTTVSEKKPVNTIQLLEARLKDNNGGTWDASQRAAVEEMIKELKSKQ